MPPFPDLVGIAAEHRLVELDYGGVQRIEFARFRVEGACHIHRHRRVVAIELVGRRIDHGHRPRHRDLYRPVGLRQHEFEVVREHRFRATHGADAAADLRQPAPISGPFLRQNLVVEPGEAHGDIGEIGTTPLFTVADDIDPGDLLIVYGHPGRVVHGVGQQIAREDPIRALPVNLFARLVERYLFHQPRWLRHGSHDRCEKWFRHSDLPLVD